MLIPSVREILTIEYRRENDLNRVFRLSTFQYSTGRGNLSVVRAGDSGRRRGNYFMLLEETTRPAGYDGYEDEYDEGGVGGALHRSSEKVGCLRFCVPPTVNGSAMFAWEDT